MFTTIHKLNPYTANLYLKDNLPLLVFGKKAHMTLHCVCSCYYYTIACYNFGSNLSSHYFYTLTPALFNV